MRRRKKNFKFIGLMPRIYALAIDAALFGFLMYSLKDVASHILATQSALVAFFFYLSLPQFFVLYIILFHSLWGQTLGKMVMCIKIYTINHKEIGFMEAFTRESIIFVLQLVSLFGFFIALQNLPSYYASPEMMSRGAGYVSELISAARNRNPVNLYLFMAYAVWMASIIISTTRSQKKRSINDKIAGTVILKTNY